jgi:hypothetical protein
MIDSKVNKNDKNEAKGLNISWLFCLKTHKKLILRSAQTECIKACQIACIKDYQTECIKDYQTECIIARQNWVQLSPKLSA